MSILTEHNNAALNCMNRNYINFDIKHNYLQRYSIFSL